MKQILTLVSAALFCSAVSAQQITAKPITEPAPIPASASEAHTPSTPVYPVPLYYNDVTIQAAPAIDQRNVKLSVAFNGWLYAAYSTYDSVTDAGGITIRSSRDNGQTWSTLDSYTVPGVRYPAHDIVVCGTDTNSLTLYLVGVNNNVSPINFVLFIDRYNATTGGFIGSNFNQSNSTRPVYDVAIASDYRYPAVNAAPYSVGIVYSTFSPIYDSVCFLGSMDGGASWGVRRMIATTGAYHRGVSIAYGRSVSASNGRYFAAWEQISSIASRTGHIFTSRSASMVDGSWIPKVNLDSISSTMINLCRNPEIAVQYNNTDNDSASCTAIVLCDRDYYGDGTDYDLLGFYNKRSHFTNFWYRLDVDNSGSNCMHPDVSYDPAYNNFIATHYDSTAGQLPYYVTGFNLATPNSWAGITMQYNDMTTNLKAPYPRVEINPVVNQAAHVWISEGANGCGVALFDAEFVITGISTPRGGNTVSVYPNPATDLVNVAITASGESVVNIYNVGGELIESRKVTQANTTFNATEWSAGLYIVEVVNGTSRTTTRIAVQH